MSIMNKIKSNYLQRCLNNKVDGYVYRVYQNAIRDVNL